MLRITYKDSQLFNDNAGFVHLFADVFVTIYEKGGLDDREKYLEEWYSRALEAVDTAIELDPDYAKYYATKARIILIKKAYFEAEAYINRAISYEKSSRSDYALRISNYQYYKMMIQMQKRMDALEEKYAAMAAARYKEHDSQEYNHMPIAYQGDDPYVFVSYSHKDSDRVYPIITALQNHGARIWYDEGIDLGDEFAEVLAPRIKDANIFLLMITPNIMNAEWVRKELSYAISRGKKVVCVHVTDTILSPGVELTINPYTQIYKYEMTEHEFYRKILTTMRNNKTVNNPERI